MIIDESHFVRTKHGTVDVQNLLNDLRLVYTSNLLLTKEEMEADIYEQKQAILQKLREVKPVAEDVLDGLIYQLHEVHHLTSRDVRDLREKLPAGLHQWIIYNQFPYRPFKVQIAFF